jgi:peptidoglycan/LPS O-acetylase OafA/YrhL
MFAFGALAAVLTWLVTRKPWDALGASAVVAVSYAVLSASYLPVLESYGARWWWFANMAAVSIAIFAGCALVAWLLQRRINAQCGGVDLTY